MFPKRTKERREQGTLKIIIILICLLPVLGIMLVTYRMSPETFRVWKGTLETVCPIIVAIAVTLAIKVALSP